MTDVEVKLPPPAVRRRSSKRRATMTVPYAAATTGRKAREEIIKVLRRFGCGSIGFMEDSLAADVTCMATPHAMLRW